MGGRIAMETRLRHPGPVRALALSDTSPAPETQAGAELRRETAERLIAEGMRPCADEVIDKRERATCRVWNSPKPSTGPCRTSSPASDPDGL